MILGTRDDTARSIPLMGKPTLDEALEKLADEGEVDAAAPTEMAGLAEAETGSVFAWGLDEDGPSEDAPWATPRQITAAAVAISLALVGMAVVIAVHQWGNGWEPRSEPSTPTRTAVIVPSVTAEALPAPAPRPVPPVTVTVQAAPKTVQTPPSTFGQNPTTLSPQGVAAYDRVFIANLQSEGWTITDPAAMAKNAHIVCGMFAQGDPVEYVNQQLAQRAEVSDTAALLFTSEAMVVYPGCREP